jgi:hypothetical protein
VVTGAQVRGAAGRRAQDLEALGGVGAGVPVDVLLLDEEPGDGVVAGRGRRDDGVDGDARAGER